MADQPLILIVDDEREMAEMLKLRLECNGYIVECAYDGEEGLDKTRRFLPALVLLDVMMPKLDGYQVCKLIKSDKKTRAIKIAMFTARTQASDRLIGHDVKADAYITKPFEPEELLKTISQLITPA